MKQDLQLAGRADFHVDFYETTGRVRSSLTELVAAVGADPTRPQVLSRSFGINKNLAWKLSRLVLARDACEAVQHVPGSSGIGILLEAFERGGAPGILLSDVIAAMVEFDAMVSEHAGTRAGLELLVGSMFPDRLDAPRREANRKLSFQGNSSTWGVQADTQLAVQLMIQSAEDPRLVDVAAVSGLLGFRRLRPVTRWAVHHRHWFGAKGSRRSECIDPSRSSEEAPLIPEFSRNVPDLQLREVGDAQTYELSEGPVGNSAAFSCVFGSIERAFAPIYGDEDDDIAELSAKSYTPVERVVFDLYVHRDLPFHEAPKTCLYSSVYGHVTYPMSTADAFHLLCDADISELGCPPMTASPHVPRYGELLRLSAERLGAPLTEFRGYRYEMRYPPIPAYHVFHYPLPLR